MGERVHINSANQLYELQGYTKDITPGLEQQLRIIGHYHLTPMIPCGIKSCHRPHNAGLVIALSGDRVSNVGHICGRQFGDRFQAAYKDYADQILRPQAIQKLAELKNRLATMHMELHGLRSDTNQLCERIEAFRKRFPRVTEQLVRRSHSGENRVFETIPRSNEEISDLLATSPGGKRDQFRYKEELRGHIPGLKIFSVKLREQIVTRFVDKAEALRDTEFTSLATEKLLELENWSEDFDQTNEGARNLLSTGNSFFTPETFALIAYLATDEGKAKELRQLTLDKLFKSSVADASALKAAPLVQSKQDRARNKKMEALMRNGGR